METKKLKMNNAIERRSIIERKAEPQNNPVQPLPISYQSEMAGISNSPDTNTITDFVDWTERAVWAIDLAPFLKTKLSIFAN